MLGSVAYMLYTKDFWIELTAKFKKEYVWWDMKYGSNYGDIVKWLINDQAYNDLQIYYRWSEWWKHRWKKLLSLYIDMKDQYTEEELYQIYKTELNKTQLNKAQLNKAQLNKAELNKTELNKTELNKTEYTKPTWRSTQHNIFNL